MDNFDNNGCRGWLIVAGLIVLMLVLAPIAALASPPPTLSQARTQLSSLQSQLDQLSQQYDQQEQQLASVNQRLGVIKREEVVYARSADAQLGEIGRIGVTQYEGGQLNSSLELLMSGTPQNILSESSILTELSDASDAQIARLLASVRRLDSARTLALRAKASVLQLQKGLAARKVSMEKLVSQQETLVAQLGGAASLPGANGTTSATYTGPTSTQAERAVEFAYEQLGCPYVWGGTGPCADGFDCSGLTMTAWAYAGVAIERTSEEQWASLPHVTTLEPGDIMVFDGAGHVGIYVGNNELIDAPHTGADVELVPFTGWYQQVYDGAVQP
jgi:peptidoglycan DL-endopeptidase CwlO